MKNYNKGKTPKTNSQFKRNNTFLVIPGISNSLHFIKNEINILLCKAGKHLVS